MLPSKILDQIDLYVRAGCYDEQRIVDILCEELYAPGELERGAVAAAVSVGLAELAVEQAAWPEMTDCDRLDVAFAAIGARGVIALQNAGFTQSDGYDDFLAAYRRHPRPASVIGYCFYHEQDLHQAVLGGGMYLAFGPVDPEQEETVGQQVGEIVAEELKRAGLPVRWNGQFSQRIFVPELRWQRR